MQPSPRWQNPYLNIINTAKFFTWCIKQKNMYSFGVVGVLPKALTRINLPFLSKSSRLPIFDRHFSAEWIHVRLPLLCVRSQVTEVYDEIFPLLPVNKKRTTSLLSRYAQLFVIHSQCHRYVMLRFQHPSQNH